MGREVPAGVCSGVKKRKKDAITTRSKKRARPWDAVPHPARGRAPLTPLGKRICMRLRVQIGMKQKTACELGNVISLSQAVLFCQNKSIFVPRERMLLRKRGRGEELPSQGVGQSPTVLGFLGLAGVLGAEPPRSCRVWDKVPRSCRVWGRAPRFSRSLTPPQQSPFPRKTPVEPSSPLSRAPAPRRFCRRPCSQKAPASRPRSPAHRQLRSAAQRHSPRPYR